MKHDVQITCFGHTFRIKGVEASNSDDAGQKALKKVKQTLCVSKVEPVDENVNQGNATEVMDMLEKIMKK